MYMMLLPCHWGEKSPFPRAKSGDTRSAQSVVPTLNDRQDTRWQFVSVQTLDIMHMFSPSRRHESSVLLGSPRDPNVHGTCVCSTNINVYLVG